MASATARRNSRAIRRTGTLVKLGDRSLFQNQIAFDEPRNMTTCHAMLCSSRCVGKPLASSRRGMRSGAPNLSRSPIQ